MTIRTEPEPEQLTPPSNGDFESYAATMPETASGFLETPSEPAATTTQEGSFFDTVDTGDEYTPPSRRRVNVTKKVRRAMNRMKGKLSNIPIMYFHNQAKLNPEWELDDEEKELITDAVDTVFDVLDIEFEIEPLSWTLTSIYWVLGYPVIAFLFLLFQKKAKVMESEQQQPPDVAA